MKLNVFFLISPFILQAVLTFFDEFYYHRKRGLPLWEKIGHPLDTITILVCYAFVITQPASAQNLQILFGLGIFSCIFITKDEFVHAEECLPGEQWLHSALFILHPITLIALLVYWDFPAEDTYISFSDHKFFQQFIKAQFILISIFLSYQILYWSLLWKKLSPEKPKSTTTTTTV
jgi:hypothetical protein